MTGLKSPDTHTVHFLLLHTTSHQAFPLVNPPASWTSWPDMGGPRCCWYVWANSLDNLQEEFSLIFHESIKPSLVILLPVNPCKLHQETLKSVFQILNETIQSTVEAEFQFSRLPVQHSCYSFTVSHVPLFLLRNLKEEMVNFDIKTQTNHSEVNMLYNIPSYISNANQDNLLQQELSWNQLLLLKTNKNTAKATDTAVTKICYYL